MSMLRLSPLLLSLACAPSLGTLLDPEEGAATDPVVVETAEPALPSAPGVGESTTLVVDATDAEAWVYLSFDGGIVPVVDPMADASWDLRFRRFDVAVNGGVSGAAGHEVAWQEGGGATVPADGWRTDAPDADGDGADELALAEWYDYDEQTHVLTPKDRTWFVRRADGATHALRFLDYYAAAGTPATVAIEFTPLAAGDATGTPALGEGDVDGDGFSVEQGDCNDASEAIGPLAADRAGDGVDADCDGVDGRDADGDGHASLRSGGDDCDDDDGFVRPGAVDVWGDGLDVDCDGVDGVDADGDGSPAVFDCDDTDVTWHPEAVDYAGDGQDRDCDGVDGRDGDGDGIAADWSGGRDCDDTDAWVHPGALDLTVDGVDQDCDGTDAGETTSTGDTGDGGGGADPLPVTTVVTIDASDAVQWQGFSFADGEVTVDRGTPDGWDLALRRFVVEVNGGVSGPGAVEVSVVPGADWDAGPVSPGAWLTDLADADADGEPERAFDDWFLYDVTQHRLAPEDRVYVVRTATGTYDLQFLDYYAATGASGHPSFRWRAHPD
jgi:hypothetical protein